MPSPFPGMNPYLEQDEAWHDFHEQFCLFCRNALVERLPPDYIAKLDENIYIHERSESKRQLFARGDVTIAGKPAASKPAATATLSAPAQGRIILPVDFLRENFIEIRDRRTRALVTVIELLSPSNKRPGGDRDQFLRKRWLLMSSTAHYVEIDLLRGWPRLPVEDLPACDYYALVSRHEERPAVGLWPVHLPDRLPVIPIPLRPSDDDLLLDLQAVLHRAYDTGGYARYIYDGSPEPALPANQAQWADEILKAAGLRTTG